MIVYVLYGGQSPEHEVSLKTAATVLKALDTRKHEVYPIYISRDGRWTGLGRMPEEGLTADKLTPASRHADAASSLGEVLKNEFSRPGEKVALPLLHGANGEDGTVQGLLELLDIPYVGNGVLSAAMTLDKDVTHRLAGLAGIRQTAYEVVTRRQWNEDRPGVLRRLEERDLLPGYVKPATLGSSIGISRCEDRAALEAGIEEALRYDVKLVVEREVPGREIQVAVMGNDRPQASLPGEFLHGVKFFDFRAKYADPTLRMSIPAEIPPAAAEEIRESAIRAYEALCCSGLARVDFFLGEDGLIYLNEINALPGFTGTSMYPVMWERTDGTSYASLIEKLMDYALERSRAQASVGGVR
ncbi:D-alanine--D-alanine ligase family protein [Saccharibacillus alkalitolerans]|uniref:D-alanine--D-alanine ligase n=1 Tax=Saccharibacillus alkalitolerans TaxID=2705290 RepID=A0ABX0FA51_9BACL|nr:D-alanine--D-alanine ligase family protein [Saccharibacillus alkalitolerans]NGZ77275.1 D-alanine--D-alanine ligase [Saccharibacillus alkalitolerans]